MFIKWSSPWMFLRASVLVSVVIVVISRCPMPSLIASLKSLCMHFLSPSHIDVNSMGTYYMYDRVFRCITKIGCKRGMKNWDDKYIALWKQTGDYTTRFQHGWNVLVVAMTQPANSNILSCIMVLYWPMSALQFKDVVIIVTWSHMQKISMSVSL